MARTDVRRDSLLETGNRGSLREEIRTQDPNHGINIRLGDVLPAVGNHHLAAS